MEKLLLIFFELGFGFKFHFFGDFSITELFLLLSCPYYIRKIDYHKVNILRILTYIYMVLIFAQCISEISIGNSFNNAARGIAVNVFSYLHVIFLSYYFLKNRSNIAYLALGIVIRYSLMSNTDGIEGLHEDLVFLRLLKFTLIPIIDYVLVYVYAKARFKNIEIFICFLGASLVVMGSRSGGGIIFIAGLLSYILRKNPNLLIKRVWPIILFGLYGVYAYYVNLVLNGEIVSGNSAQLLNAGNPYNPVNLLAVGRSEVFVGFVAFMDRFWTGWGAWTSDPGMRYHIMQSVISNTIYNPANVLNDVIPSHSVLIGSGMMNGIFAFLMMLTIFVFILRKAIKLFNVPDRYTYVILFFTIDFLWHMLFSPQSAFRYILPLNMAFILISYYVHKDSNHENMLRHHW